MLAGMLAKARASTATTISARTRNVKAMMQAAAIKPATIERTSAAVCAAATKPVSRVPWASVDILLFTLFPHRRLKLLNDRLGRRNTLQKVVLQCRSALGHSGAHLGRDLHNFHAIVCHGLDAFDITLT